MVILERRDELGCMRVKGVLIALGMMQPKFA
jgi:hypothetical protein